MKNNRQLGIYIHIPFCVRKCDYCDFLSGPATDCVKAEYIEALKCEIAHTAEVITKKADRAKGYQSEAYQEKAYQEKAYQEKAYKEKIYQSEAYREKAYQVETIFIGGGTPTAVNAEFIAQLLHEVRKNFYVVPSAEITIECNPGTLTKEKADIYKGAGINRISFGLQSADDKLLKLIGRIHTWEDFEKSMEIARAAGFDNINVDIMSALPGQTLDGYACGLKKVLAYEPEHISAYSLILEEGTPLGDNTSKYPPVPDEDTEREMYYETLRILEGCGYHRYEISNYAKPGYECRHNLSYWDRKDYLGFGVGAASLFEGKRTSNIRSVDEYINLMRCSAGSTSSEAEVRLCSESEGSTSSEVEGKPCSEVEVLSREDAMSEFMFLGLRKTAGVSFFDFAAQFGEDISSIFGAAIEENVAKGLLEYVDEQGAAVKVGLNMGSAIKNDSAPFGCRLTSRGIDVSNVVLADFLL